MSLKKANEHRNAWFEGVQRCSLDETLYTVMERIVRAEVHRLVVVDENEKVIGIISLSDLLLYLVLRPSGDGIGDSESLRASDPALAAKKMTDSTSSSHNMQHNSSNESIKEETERELEKEENNCISYNNNNNLSSKSDADKKTEDEEEEVVEAADDLNGDSGTDEVAVEATEATVSPEKQQKQCNSARSDTPECDPEPTMNESSFQNVPREVALVSE